VDGALGEGEFVDDRIRRAAAGLEVNLDAGRWAALRGGGRAGAEGPEGDDGNG